METPHELRSAANERQDVAVSRYEYDGENLIAVDFGPVGEPSLDVVDGRVIVIVGDRQFEFDLPPEATDVELNNGVLTVRG